MLQLAGWNIFFCILAVYSHCLLYYLKISFGYYTLSSWNNYNNNNRDRNRTNYPWFFVIMIIESALAFISYKLKLPLVNGYIIAGIIIGPHTPPFSLILNHDIFHSIWIVPIENFSWNYFYCYFIFFSFKKVLP